MPSFSSQNCLNDLPRKSAVQNHRIFRELPGQVYDAFDQCQLLLKDKDASVYSPTDLYVSVYPRTAAARSRWAGGTADRCLWGSLTRAHRADVEPFLSEKLASLCRNAYSFDNGMSMLNP